MQTILLAFWSTVLGISSYFFWSRRWWPELAPGLSHAQETALSVLSALASALIVWLLTVLLEPIRAGAAFLFLVGVSLVFCGTSVFEFGIKNLLKRKRDSLLKEKISLRVENTPHEEETSGFQFWKDLLWAYMWLVILVLLVIAYKVLDGTGNIPFKGHFVETGMRCEDFNEEPMYLSAEEIEALLYRTCLNTCGTAGKAYTGENTCAVMFFINVKGPQVVGTRGRTSFQCRCR